MYRSKAVTGSMRAAVALCALAGVFYGILSGPRPAREPGRDWDGNPERLRVDSDEQPGTRPLDVAAGLVAGGGDLVGRHDAGAHTTHDRGAAPRAPGVRVSGLAGALQWKHLRCMSCSSNSTTGPNRCEPRTRRW